MTEKTAEELEHGDPEFAETPADGAAADIAAAADAEAAEAADAGEGAAAAGDVAAAAAGDVKEKTVAELKADLEESERVRKGLTRRVGTLSAEKRDISKKLQETIAAVPKTPDPVAGEGDGESEQPQRADFKTQAEFDAAVKTEATRVATQQRQVEAWNSKCNDVEDKGSKAFGAKWQEAKNQLSILDDEGRIPMDLLATALETDNPAQVLFALGSDLDKATELMAMTPTKRAIAMDRLAQVKTPVAASERQRSKAPDPIDPINGSGGGNDAPSDRDSDAEWHRKEGLREAARRKQKLGLA